MQTSMPRPEKIWPNLQPIVNHVSKYITPLAFGHSPDPYSYEFNSGTATLIDLGCGPLALTCAHVTTPFQEFRETNKGKINAQLFIGGATGIDRKIIDSDEALDLATLLLTTKELGAIPYNQNVCGTQFINQIYHGPLKEKDVIVFAGFPSEPSWRYKTDSNLHAFHPCVGFAEVASINNDYIICQSDYSIYEEEFSDKLLLTQDPTGLSGGAAFLLREENKKLTLSFIGIISEGKFFKENCLTIYVKLAKRLNRDGTIKKALSHENH